MLRPKLEVADILRDHGAAWRSANADHVSLDQLKVMTAIERCRTAALGGHVERCANGSPPTRPTALASSSIGLSAPGITPHIPVWDRSTREEGILSRADFTFDPERNLYICPQGKFLRTTGTVPPTLIALADEVIE
jgi:hypothetical protein